MAKVKSVPINTSTVVNDASLAELVSLEITEELSPSNDIDIDLFLNSNETYSEEQCFDKWSVKRIDNSLSGKAYTPSNCVHGKKSVNSNVVSLGSLAENHLEKDNMLSELCFDKNFSLSNILSNDTSEIKNSKSTISNDSLALFDLCLETDAGLQTTESKPEKDSFDLFLSSLNEKSDSDASTSLNDILSPEKRDFPKHDVKIHFNFSPKPSSRRTSSEQQLLSDILGSSPDQERLVDNISSELADLLDHNLSSSTSFSSDISEPFLSGNLEFSSYSSNGKDKSGERTPDLEFIPDLNLNFCVREDVKVTLKSSLKTLETEDSGYETDYPLGQLCSAFEKNQANSTLLNSNCLFTEKNAVKARHSLFSKALSAKPRIDGNRKQKLQMIRRKLCTDFPDCYLECDKHKNSSTVENVIDHTEESVVTSVFLTVPTEN